MVSPQVVVVATREPSTTPDAGARDDLALLTGPEAGDLLAAAIATAGGELLGWRVRQVDHRPGRSTTVSYDTSVRWGDRTRRETMGASTGLGPVPGGDPHPGVLTLSDGHREVSVWRFPLDPRLPGLNAACDRPTVAAWLTRFGVRHVDPDRVHLEVRSYRPGRRAVVAATVPGAGRLFLKVLRPAAASGVHRRHRLMTEAGLPVPRSLGWTDEGVLVLQALTGSPMRGQLDRGGPVPSGEDLVDLVLHLPRALLEFPARPSWTDGAAHYARVIGATLPDQAEPAAALAHEIGPGTRELPADEPCHGDLYEAQLLLDGARVTGLLDVDTAGPGRHADDLACLIAHAEVLALLRPAAAARLRGVVHDWQAAAERRVDPGELRLRVAGVLLSLATGPHRVQERDWPASTRARLELAARWVDRAQERTAAIRVANR